MLTLTCELCGKKVSIKNEDPDHLLAEFAADLEGCAPEEVTFRCNECHSVVGTTEAGLA